MAKIPEIVGDISKQFSRNVGRFVNQPLGDDNSRSSRMSAAVVGFAFRAVYERAIRASNSQVCKASAKYNISTL